MATELQNFLRENGPDALIKTFGVYYKQHPKYPNLYQFTYDQIEADAHKAHPVVRQSRGIILDKDNDWGVVARPFDRFFNVGEACAAPVDWKTSRVQEKVDGSLCIVYYYDNQWHVATKGTPDASGNVNGFSFTFAELFWSIAKKQGVDKYLEIQGEKQFTYMFELTTIFNKVVVRYPEPKLTLIGVRHTECGTELKTDALASLVAMRGYSWRGVLNPVKEYGFSSQEDMVKFAKNINGTQGEGFVVVDDNFNRIKVKSDNYIALSHMKDGFGPRRAMEIVRKAEGDEVQVYIDAFPEFKSLFDETRSKYSELLNHLKDSYECIKHIENQKEFAILAVQTKLSGALFNVRKGTTTFEKYLAEMNIKHLMEVCGMKYDVEANDELV
jgi:T4 RnlA family RNA ligase